MSAQPRFFGAFLVMKKIITADQLVAALLAQSAETPSMTQVIYEAKLLPSESWLKVFEYQTINRVDFKTACLALSLWTPAMEAQVQSVIGKNKSPLGHILLKQQATDLTTLTKALDEFLAAASETSPPSIPLPVEVAKSSSGQKFSAKSFEFLELDDSILGDFSDFFSVGKIQTLCGLAERALASNQKDDGAKELVSEISNQAHMLKGVAVCLRIPITAAILDHIEEDCLRDFRKEGRLPDADQLRECLLSLKSLTSVRERILQDRSEKNLWIEAGQTLEGVLRKTQA